MRTFLVVCIVLETFVFGLKKSTSLVPNLESRSFDLNQSATIHSPKIELFNANLKTSKPMYPYGIAPIPIHEPHTVEANTLPASSASPPFQWQRIETMKYTPLLSALVLNSLLKLGRYQNSLVGRNSLEHEPTNPFVELLLSHYGKYLPRFAGSPYGFYSYTASNNLHNNKPFGTYKIVYEH